MDGADRVRVRHHHGALEHPRVANPIQARDLAVPVDDERPGEHRGRCGAPARQDCGHAGAHGALADHELAVAADQRGMSDGDPGDVRDRV
jgi:hypothetical protein